MYNKGEEVTDNDDKLTQEQLERVTQLKFEDNSDQVIAQELGWHRNTVLKYKKLEGSRFKFAYDAGDSKNERYGNVQFLKKLGEGDMAAILYQKKKRDGTLNPTQKLQATVDLNVSELPDHELERRGIEALEARGYKVIPPEEPLLIEAKTEDHEDAGTELAGDE